MPVAEVSEDNLQEYANLAPGLIVSPTYSDEWVVKNLIEGQKK